MTRAVEEAMTPNYKKRARRQARFLRAYARYGTIRAGAKAAGVPRDVIMQWATEEDGTFLERCADAWANYADSVLEGVVQKGRQGHAPSLHFLARILLKNKESPFVDEAAQLAWTRDYSRRAATVDAE